MVRDKLKFMIKSSWTCQTCGKDKSNSAPSYILQLECFTATISDLLAGFCKTQEVKDFTCASCQTKGVATKKDQISKTSKYVVIELKRYLFQRGNIKKNTKIKDPLSALILSEDQYHLQSVIIHTGQDGAGHYVTIKKEQLKWLMFDDTDVSEIEMSKAAALAQFGYMFVFCK